MRRACLLLLGLCGSGCNGLLGNDEPIVGEGATSTQGPSETDDVDPMEGSVPSVCGDGIRDGAEECDDGNAVDADGCSECQLDCGPAPAFRDETTGHCYLEASEQGVAWSDAEASCVAWGGHLASITSDDELGLVGQRLMVDVWIGASAGGANSSFEWINGDPWGYEVWDVDEPSEEGSCVAIVAAHTRFAARECSELRGYLCERGPTEP